MAGADIALASARAYTRRYLTRARWRETWQGARLEGTIILRQSPVISVESVMADGQELVVTSDYRVDYFRSSLNFVSAWWYCEPDELVIIYEAGFDPLPADLQHCLDAAAAVIDAAPAAGLAGIASVDMPDVGSVRFNAGEVGNALLPALQPFESTLSLYRDNSLLWAQPGIRRLEPAPPARQVPS